MGFFQTLKLYNKKVQTYAIYIMPTLKGQKKFYRAFKTLPKIGIRCFVVFKQNVLWCFAVFKQINTIFLRCFVVFQQNI